MRTNLAIDDKLVTEALSVAYVKNKNDVINLALKEFIERHKRKNLIDLKAKIKFLPDYNYKELRN